MPTRRDSVGGITAGIVATCFAGLALSYYAYVVELAKERDETYEAMCDISEHVSCSKAFMSEYGKGFGLIPPDSPLYMPNCLYGLAFYSLVAALSASKSPTVSLAVAILAALSNVASVYLAVILYLLKNVCVVCVCTYAVNAIIFALAVKRLRILRLDDAKKEE